jgi:hypothetical protein
MLPVPACFSGWAPNQSGPSQAVLPNLSLKRTQLIVMPFARAKVAPVGWAA